MKLKSLLLGLGLLFTSSSLFASEFLCSYTAQISESDKYNSSGKHLAVTYTKATVAGILRQDRANFYVYGIRDAHDTEDCTMSSKSQRAIFEKLLNNSDIPQSFIRKVIDGNPIIDIRLHKNHIEASLRSF